MPGTSCHIVIAIDEMLLGLHSDGFFTTYQTIGMATWVEGYDTRNTLYVDYLLPVVHSAWSVVFDGFEFVGESATTNQLVASMLIVATNFIDYLPFIVVIDS